MKTNTLLRMTSIAVLCTVVHAQVISIDFGSQFIKVAGIKPAIGIDVVLNEQSKRKSNNYVGYRGDDRFLGEDAHNFAPRFPDQMFTFLNRLAGKEYSDEAFRTGVFQNEFGLLYPLTEDKERKTIKIANPDPATEYTIEELLAQLLNYVKKQAEKHLEIEITGAVITTPYFVSISEREAFVQAGNLTGLPILSLVHNTLAASLQYGVQRRGFGNQTTNVVIYDMGASRTEVGVFKFTAPTEVNGKPKRGGELGNLETVAVTYDESLGGRSFTRAIANYLKKKFEEKTGLSFEGKRDKAALKANTVLFNHANKAKEVLSANKAAPVNIEELYDGKPFFYNLGREEFETIAKDLFDRAVPPLTAALEKANLKPEDIHAFEIVGGGVRIPKLQDSLSAALDNRKLDKTLNGDECFVLGAAFEGARLSGTFRTKGFTVTDTPPYNVSFKLSQLDNGKEPKMRPLFSNAVFGSKKSVTLARKENFDVNLFVEKPNQEPKLLKAYHIEGVADALDKVGFNKEGKNESNKHSVQLHVKLTPHGLIELESATVKYEEHLTVQKKIKIKEPKNSTSTNTTESESEDKKDEKSEDKKDEKEEEKKDDEKKEEEKDEKKEEEKDEKKDEKDEKKDEKEDPKAPEEPKYKFVNKTEVKKHKQGLSYTVETTAPHPMNDEQFNQSIQVLKKLQEIEDVKRQAAAAKNDLETYIYWVKYDGILDNEEMQPFITEEDKESIAKVVEEVSEWAEYGEGSEEGCKKELFLEKKKAIEEVVSKVTDKKKAKEAEERLAKLKEQKEKEKAEKEKQKQNEKEEKESQTDSEEEDKEKAEKSEDEKDSGEKKGESEL